MENIRLYLVTYNVGTSNPDQNLKELLNIKHKHDSLPDFYALSFQEVKAQPQNMLMDSLFEDAWTFACKELLKAKGYVKLKSIRLQGLLLVLFGLRKHLLNIRELESEYTRTGFSGMWGNKGAVSIRLGIYGCSICFVNSHLSAHDHQLKQRVEDYNSIVRDQEFHVEETSKIFYHDYVFWAGDLNFRLLEDYDRTPEEIQRSIIKDCQTLFQYDQLRYVMRKGEAFSELTEQDPTFPPTFKYEVGTSSYDYKRRPAWCDRILHCVNQNNYENVILNVSQISYKWHPSYVLSDHKPVSAEFVIKMPHAVVGLLPRGVAAFRGRSTVAQDGLSINTFDQVFSDYSECVIQFEKIISWEGKEENKAYYKVTKEMPPTKEDWIGLFKENFCSIDDYITYEYVSKCVTPTPEDKPDRASPNPESSPRFIRPTRYEVSFSELPSRCHGNYCLVYFSQTEDKVTSILGISDPFPVVKNDSD